MLGAGSVVVFSGIGAYVAVVDPNLSQSAVKLAVDVGVLAISLGSLMIRKPFVLQYALEEVDAETAKLPDFLKATTIITWAWTGACVLMIVGNTIRLEINGRRAEIEVTKLVGGSNAFVRRPFLYSGFWHGLGGGVLAVALVAAGLAALGPFVDRLAAAYGAAFALRGLAPDEWPLVIGGGALLGLVGAWLAATYHLRRIEPRA